MDELINAHMLRALRIAKGWNQKQLAHVANVDASIISRLERGIQNDLKVSVLVALATALETSVSNLLIGQVATEQKDVASLRALLDKLAELPKEYQEQVAAILRAYISTMPNIETKD